MGFSRIIAEIEQFHLRLAVVAVVHDQFEPIIDNSAGAEEICRGDFRVVAGELDGLLEEHLCPLQGIRVVRVVQDHLEGMFVVDVHPAGRLEEGTQRYLVHARREEPLAGSVIVAAGSGSAVAVSTSAPGG